MFEFALRGFFLKKHEIRALVFSHVDAVFGALDPRARMNDGGYVCPAKCW